MDPLDDLLESMEEASPEGDADAARQLLQKTAAGLTDMWEDTAALKARLRELTQLLNVFLKAGKTLRLYNEDHNFFDGFVEEFVSRLYVQLETIEAVTFEVTPQSINWDGHPIFSNPDQRENMAFKLYRDGIRMLQFRKGCSTEEVREFVSLVTRDLKRGKKAGDDLSILFWEADFKSIQIAVAETFVDYSEEAAQVLKNIQEDLKELHQAFTLDLTEDERDTDYRPMAYRGLDLTSQSLGSDDEKGLRATDLDGNTALKIYRAGGDSGGEDELIDANPNRPYTPKLPLEIFDDERMQGVYEDLQGIDNPFATFEDVGIVLATVVTVEENSSELARILERLDDALSPLLSAATLGPLNSILRRLSLIERTVDPHRAFRGNLLRLFFSRICKADRLRLISQAINTGWSDELRGELFTFVSLQKQEDIEELLRFLGQVRPLAPRRVIVDALLLLTNREAEEFTLLTDDGNPQLACDALYALSRIGNSLTISRICGTFQRPEPTVREAVLTSLRNFQSPRIHRLMVDALADPDLRVRLAALRYITVYRIKDAIGPISDTIAEREFAKLDFDERRGWFIALGHLAGSEILQTLQSQAEPSRGSSQITESVHLVLLGIKAIRSAESKKWLEGFAASTSGDLQLLTHKILAGRKRNPS